MSFIAKALTYAYNYRRGVARDAPKSAAGFLKSCSPAMSSLLSVRRRRYALSSFPSSAEYRLGLDCQIHTANNPTMSSGPLR